MKFTTSTERVNCTDDFCPVLWIEAETEAERYQLAALTTKLHAQRAGVSSSMPQWASGKVIRVDLRRAL